MASSRVANLSFNAPLNQRINSQAPAIDAGQSPTSDQTALLTQITALTSQVTSSQSLGTPFNQDISLLDVETSTQAPAAPVMGPLLPSETVTGIPLIGPQLPSAPALDVPLIEPQVPSAPVITILPTPKTPAEIKAEQKAAHQFAFTARRESQKELVAARVALASVIQNKESPAAIATLKAKVKELETERNFWLKQSALPVKSIKDPTALLAIYQNIKRAFNSNDQTGTVTAQINTLRTEANKAIYSDPLASPDVGNAAPLNIDPREELGHSSAKVDFYHKQGSDKSNFWKGEERFWTTVSTRLSNGPQNLHGTSKRGLETALLRQTSLENDIDQSIGVNTQDPKFKKDLADLKTQAERNKAAAKNWIKAAQFDAKFGESSAGPTDAVVINAKANKFAPVNLAKATTLLRNLQTLNSNLEQAILNKGVGSPEAIAANTKIATARSQISALALP